MLRSARRPRHGTYPRVTNGVHQRAGSEVHIGNSLTVPVAPTTSTQHSPLIPSRLTRLASTKPGQTGMGEWVDRDSKSQTCTGEEIPLCSTQVPVASTTSTKHNPLIPSRLPRLASTEPEQTDMRERTGTRKAKRARERKHCCAQPRTLYH